MYAAFTSSCTSSFLHKSKHTNVSISSFCNRIRIIPHLKVCQTINLPCCVDSIADQSNSSSVPTTSSISTTKIFTEIDPNTSALREGILMTAIGKQGVKSLPSDLINRISIELNYLTRLKAIPTALIWQRASFLGSLYMKSPRTDEEEILLANACNCTPGQNISGSSLISTICKRNEETPQLIEFAERLLNKEFLNMMEAEQLGKLIYSRSGSAPSALTAMIAHVMRVRHESGIELAGLARAAAESSKELWTKGLIKIPTNRNRLRAHLAEPFDGTLTWDLLTPLICKHLYEKYEIDCVMSVGRSSGPKNGPNLLQVVRALGLRSCRTGEDVIAGWERPDGFGAVVNQSDASPGLDKWVQMRRVIAKRPAIATIEKYIDICLPRADIFIASAFHDNYVEKMAQAAEGIGYERYVIIGRGMEGTLGLGVRRKARMLVGWIEEDRYEREEIRLHGGKEDVIEEINGERPKKGDVDAGETALKIRKFVSKGRSGDERFDERVKNTLRAIDNAMQVLKKGRGW